MSLSCALAAILEQLGPLNLLTKAKLYTSCTLYQPSDVAKYSARWRFLFG